MHPRRTAVLAFAGLALLAAPAFTADQLIDWKKARQHWSFRPPVAHPGP